MRDGGRTTHTVSLDSTLLTGARSPRATRRVSLALGLSLVLGLFAPLAPLAGASSHGPIELHIGHYAVDSGASVVAMLTMTNVTDYGSLTLDIEYDPGIVNLTNATVGTIPSSSITFNPSFSPGVARLLVDSVASPPASGDLLVAYVGLRADGSPGAFSPLNLTVEEFVDSGGNPVSVTPFDGGFSVNSDPGPGPGPYVSVEARNGTAAGEAISSLEVRPWAMDEEGFYIRSYVVHLRINGSEANHYPTTSAPSGPNPNADGFNVTNVTVEGALLPMPGGSISLDVQGSEVRGVVFDGVAPTRVGGEIRFRVDWKGVETVLLLPVTRGANATISPAEAPAGQETAFTVQVQDAFGNPVPSASLLLLNPSGQPYPGTPGMINGTGAPGLGQNGQYAFNVNLTSGDLYLGAQIGSDAGGIDSRNWSYAHVRATGGSSCPPGQHYDLEQGACVPDGGTGGGSGDCAGEGSIAGLVFANASGSGPMFVRVSQFGCHGMNATVSGDFSQGVPYSFSGLSPTVWHVEAWFDGNGNGNPDEGEPYGNAGMSGVDAAQNRTDANVVVGGGTGGGGGGEGGWGCTRTYDASQHATIRGFVKDANRQPAANTSLNFENRATDAGEGFANTNETGYYTCIVPGGDYQINAWGPGGQAYPWVTLENGTETWLNFSLSFNARPPYELPEDFFGGTVWGNITVGGEGVAGIRLNIHPSQAPGQEPNPACNEWTPGERSLTCYGDAETDANGTWVATGLHNGTYNVHIDGSAAGVASEYVQNAFTVANATTDGESKQDVGVIDFDPPAYIRGRVNTTGDAPVEFANVQAYPHCGPTGPGESCGSFGWTTTDENGEYTLVVSAGRYGMSAGTGDMYTGSPLSSDRRDCHDGPDARCVVTSNGNTTWVNFTLRPGHVLSGQVVKQEGESDVPVRAFIQAESCTPNGPCQFAWGQTAWNNSGWFSLTLDPGTYRVRIEPDRFEEPDLGVYTAEVTISEGSDAHLGVVRLGTAGFIEGNVTDPDGQPLAGINVFAHEHREPGDFGGPGGFGGWAHTDENGHYRLAGLRTGSYDVEFDSWGSGYMRQRNESVPVVEGQTTWLDARLSEGGVLAGYVLQPDGTGVANAFVDAFWMPMHHGPGSHEDFPSSGGWGHAMTDASGYYAIRGLTDGTFGMYVRPPFDSSLSSASVDPMSGDVPTVTIGQTTYRNFTLSAGATVQGCVKDPTGQDAISWAWVTAFSRTHGFGGGEPTGFDGCFTLRGVRPGTYDIEVNPPPGSAYGRTVVESVRVNESENVDLGTIRLRAGIALAGRVLDSNGQGVPNVFVNAWQKHEDGPMAGPGAFGFAQTDAEGNFVVRGLVAGRYGVHVQPRYESGLSSKFIDDLRLPEEGLSGYEIRLGGGGWINGTVLGPDGNPLRGAWVGAWSHEGGSGSGGVTDANGRFNLSGLTPARDYNLDVQPPWGRQDLAGYHQFPLQVNESEGTLPGPGRDGIVQLGQGGSLQGRILDEAGVGVSSAFVNVGGRSTFGWGMTDEAGNFTVRGLNAAAGDRLHVYVQPGPGSRFTPFGTEITWSPGSEGVMDAGDITLSAGKNFSGTLTRGGAAVADVDVHLWPSLDESGRPMGPPGGGSATTDSNGNFTVRGLPAGYYDISLQPRDGSAGRFIPRGVLISSANDTTGFALTLEPGGDLPVRVVVSGTSDGIPNAQVDCFNPALHAGRGNRTGSDGVTLLQGLPEGSYKCRAEAPGYQPKAVDGVAVTSGTNAQLQIALTAVTPSRINGTYANGSASSGHFVIMVPTGGQIGDEDATGFNTTTSQGAFVIPDMPYGTYDIKVVSPTGILVAYRQGVVVDEPTEDVGALTYDPNLGG